MDIPDFELVIQWKVQSLSMCTMMQRLGRAARDPSLQGTFVLFAESKYFDKNKEDGTDPATQGNTTQHPCNPSQSADPITNTTTGTAARDPPPIMTAPSIDEIRADRKLIYSKSYYTQQAALTNSNGRKRQAEDGPDPGVDDTINASERGLNCRREPGTITFDNDNLGEL